jgi:hypothetical protein
MKIVAAEGDERSIDPLAICESRLRNVEEVIRSLGGQLSRVAIPNALSLCPIRAAYWNANIP